MCCDVAVKAYCLERSSAVFRNDPQAEWDALQHLQPIGIAPEPIYFGMSEQTPILIYRFVEVSPSALEVRSAAQLLNQFREYEWDSLPQVWLGSEWIISRADLMLGELPNSARDWATAHRPQGQVAPHSGRLCHGDFVGANILVVPSAQPTSTSLQTGEAMPAIAIDWQTPYRTSAAWDIAMFLSPSMQHRYGMNDVDEAAFLNTIKDGVAVEHFLELRPWFHWLMAIYALWREDAWGDSAGRFDFKLEAAALDQMPD